MEILAKTIVATHRGQITDTIEVPDHATRQRAVRDGWDVRGRLKRPDAEQGLAPIIVNLTIEQKEQIEGLTGRPLKVDCYTIVDPDGERQAAEAANDSVGGKDEPSALEKSRAVAPRVGEAEREEEDEGVAFGDYTGEDE